MERSSHIRWDLAHALILCVATVCAWDRRDISLLYWPAALSFVFFIWIHRHELLRCWQPNSVSFLRFILISLMPFFPDWAAPLFLVHLGLDYVDGWLARRLEKTSLIGGFFDMQVDAYSILLVATILVCERGFPAWILIAGLMRYVFVIWRWLMVTDGFPERRSHVARWIFLFTALVYFSAARRGASSVHSLLLLAAAQLSIVLSFTPDFWGAFRNRVLTKLSWPRTMLFFIGINALLFMPAYLCTGIAGDLTQWIDGFAWTASLQATYLAELGIVVLLLSLLSSRVRAYQAALIVGTVVLTALFVYEIYDGVIHLVLNRAPVFAQDFPLVKNGIDFISQTWGYAAVIGLAVVIAIVVAGAFWIFNNALKYLALGTSQSFIAKIAVSLSTLICLISTSWHGVGQIWQTRSANIVFNVQQSFAEYAENSDPDQQESAYARAPLLAKKPDIFIMFMESYGEIIFADLPSRRPFEKFLGKIDKKLASHGYAAVSGMARSPTFGGASWFASSTLLAGKWIDTPLRYRQLGPRQSNNTLVSYLKQQGYVTTSIEPGTSVRAKGNIFNFDQFLPRSKLNYPGERSGWGVIPDDWSLNYAHETYLSSIERPRFVMFKTVSTHSPWNLPPCAKHWRERAGIDVKNNCRYPAYQWHPDPLYGRYLDTIAFDWNILVDYITKVVDRPTMFVVIGDHQPPSLHQKLNHREKTHLTPVHVISKDHEAMNLLRSTGLVRSLIPSRRFETDHAKVMALTFRGLQSKGEITEAKR